MKKIFLLDINLWVALAFDNHDHHGPALKWAESAADGTLSFCRMTQQGFLRLATNKQVLRKHVLNLAEAWVL
ncbi:MAG TPA: hypothetical protein VHY37_12115 [Tepidisphaeraceae bacterium]|jgi:hypothetical protein|nr:hypothetical protein [Tepidisphaeraceae bacterium]